MSVFESLNNTADSATDIGEKYIKTSHRYFKLKVFQQLTVTVSFLGKALIIGALILAGLIFTAFAAAIAIGRALDNLSLGYLIIGLIFCLLAFIAYYLRAHINRKVISSMSQKFFDD